MGTGFSRWVSSMTWIYNNNNKHALSFSYRTMKRRWILRRHHVKNKRRLMSERYRTDHENQVYIYANRSLIPHKLPGHIALVVYGVFSTEYRANYLNFCAQPCFSNLAVSLAGWFPGWSQIWKHQKYTYMPHFIAESCRRHTGQA